MDLTQQLARKPVPEQSLALLRTAAFGDTGGSVAARSFLFYLVGKSDPSGHENDGALELRRLDPRHHQAALEVFTWWTSGTQDDQPVYDILDELSARFKTDDA